MRGALGEDDRVSAAIPRLSHFAQISDFQLAAVKPKHHLLCTSILSPLWSAAVAQKKKKSRIGNRTSGWQP